MPVKRFWTLVRSDDSKSALMCDLFDAGQGLEVRCHDRATTLKIERVASMNDVLNLCAAWKAMYRGDGWIEPVE